MRARTYSFAEVLRKLFFASLFFIVLFSGCQAPTPYQREVRYTQAPYGLTRRIIPIYIDASFGEADKVALEQGIQQWNYALNGNVILKVENWHYELGIMETTELFHRHGFIIVNINSIHALVRDKKSTILAFADSVPGKAIYFIRDRIKNEDMTNITLHEIGHVLGANHRDHNLMDPTYNPNSYRCIDFDTLHQVADQLGFDPKLGNYCYDVK